MSDGGLREDIVDLEERIERMRDSLEHCRKISFAAKIAIAGGLVWIALVLIGAVPSTPAPLFSALAAVLSGIVLLGSNKTTWEQTEAAMHETERLRAQLIGGIPLRVVSEERPTLH
jgi:hypothetical protein